MMTKGFQRTLLVMTPIFLFFCCASFAEIESTGLTYSEQVLTHSIVKAARNYVGATSLTARGKKFNVDCTGGVMASYYLAGIDLWPIMAPYEGNGVKRLYNGLKDKGLLHRNNYPVPGDLIFWDNTWDRNRNGLVDDPLTHIGLVISCDDAGNIEYFHHHIALGYVIEKMNLKRPDVYRETVDGKSIVVNNAIRARGLKKDKGYLASQLCRNFGQAWVDQSDGTDSGAAF